MQGVKQVEAQTVGPGCEPAAHHVQHPRPHLRVPVVEVRLKGQKAREIPLLRGLVIVPARGSEHRPPVVGWLSTARPTTGPPNVEIAHGMLAQAAGSEKPRVLGRRVVEHDVEHDLHTPGMNGVEQAPHVFARPILGGDTEMVRDVVAQILLGALEERGDEQRLDPQILEVVQFLRDPSKITDAITIRVFEGPRIDMVDGGAVPPWLTGRRRFGMPTVGSVATIHRAPGRCRRRTSLRAGEGPCATRCPPPGAPRRRTSTRPWPRR